MAEILKNNSFMALPSSIKRGNPAPLDVTEIWFSYDEMANYAATNATAYVGQQMALVNEDEKTAKAYIILNTDGDLQEIGSGVLTDNLSVAINDEGALHLHDYGVKYYKFVKAVGEEGADDYVAAHYEPQVVDADHPWIAGLEPRVTLEGENLVLGWYEPNPTTVEGVQDQVVAVQGTVENLDNVLNSEGGLVDQVEDLQEEIGHAATETGDAATGLYAELDKKADTETVNAALSEKANSADVYTIEQANKAIGDAVAGADHLKRKIMGSLEEVEAYAATNDDATQYIFMVSNGLQADDNRYYEYMVFEVAGEDGAETTRVVERVGNWAVDLSGYATTGALEALSQTVADNKSAIEQSLADEVARAEAAEKALGERIDAIDFIDSDELNTALEPYAKTADVTTALEPYAKTEDVNDALDEKADAATTLAGYGITDAYTKTETLDKIAEKITEINGGESAGEVLSQLNSYKETNDARVDVVEDKLDTIANGAEVNVINSVDENEFNIDNRNLSLKSVPASKLTDLLNHEVITGLQDQITINTTNITNLTQELNNYVTLAAYQTEIAAIKSAISWVDI